MSDLFIEEFIPAMDQPSPFAFCDVYEVHLEHTYRAINTNYYRCSGFTSEDLAEAVRSADDLCEHGMSAALCGGPMHWYDS